MKKFLSLFLVMVIMIGFTGCSAYQDSKKEKQEAEYIKQYQNVQSDNVIVSKPVGDYSLKLNSYAFDEKNEIVLIRFTFRNNSKKAIDFNSVFTVSATQEDKALKAVDINKPAYIIGNEKTAVEPYDSTAVQVTYNYKHLNVPVVLEFKNKKTEKSVLKFTVKKDDLFIYDNLTKERDDYGSITISKESKTTTTKAHTK